MNIKFSPLKVIKNIGKALFTVTLIPYGISTYKELKTVDWMSYWDTIRVTSFVILFSVLTASFVYGADQIISRLFDLIIKKV